MEQHSLHKQSVWTIQRSNLKSGESSLVHSLKHFLKTYQATISRVAITNGAKFQVTSKAFLGAAGYNEGRVMRLGWASGRALRIEQTRD